ncbi:MAG: redoxin domain-containing protein [Pseudomonadota bacterium]
MLTRRTLTAAGAAVLALSLSTGSAFAASAVVGEAAPGFVGDTSDGTGVSLADYAGKTVVLEWTNHDCPYVKKHYDTGNMQGLQTAAADEDVVWLSVISSAPGKQGHVSGAKANTLTTSRNAAPAAVVLDESGEIGKLYGAKTTPHMYVIDGEGVLRYAGAIDDKRSTKPATVEGATNYVSLALADMAEGRDVGIAETAPYGCSVKY